MSNDKELKTVSGGDAKTGTKIGGGIGAGVGAAAAYGTMSFASGAYLATAGSLAVAGLGAFIPPVAIGIGVGALIGWAVR